MVTSVLELRELFYNNFISIRMGGAPNPAYLKDEELNNYGFLNELEEKINFRKAYYASMDHLHKFVDDARQELNLEHNSILDINAKKEFFDNKLKEVTEIIVGKPFSSIFTVDGFHKEVYSKESLIYVLREAYKDYFKNDFDVVWETLPTHAHRLRIPDEKLADECRHLTLDRLEFVYKEIIKAKVLHLEYNRLFNISTAEENAENIPNQSQDPNLEPVKKYEHTNIFKDNAFEVWEYMFEEFQINSSSRTDIKFMYERMKGEGLIHFTVTYSDMLNEWIPENHDVSVDRETRELKYSSNRERVYKAAIKKFWKKISSNK